ncbi:hypothetical protein YC2023_052402 [Brassica napus]
MPKAADLYNQWAAYAGLMVYIHLRSQKVFSAGVTPSALELLITLVYIALDPHMLEVRKTYEEYRGHLSKNEGIQTNFMSSGNLLGLGVYSHQSWIRFPLGTKLSSFGQSGLGLRPKWFTW